MKKAINYNERALVQQDDEKIIKEQKEIELKEMKRKRKRTKKKRNNMDVDDDDSDYEEEDADGEIGLSDGNINNKMEAQGKVSKIVPFAETLGIQLDHMVRSYARNGMTVYIPMELSSDVDQVVFEIEKYKEQNEETDKDCAWQNSDSLLANQSILLVLEAMRLK